MLASMHMATETHNVLSSEFDESRTTSVRRIDCTLAEVRIRQSVVIQKYRHGLRTSSKNTPTQVGDRSRVQRLLNVVAACGVEQERALVYITTGRCYTYNFSGEEHGKTMH